MLTPGFFSFLVLGDGRIDGECLVAVFAYVFVRWHADLRVRLTAEGAKLVMKSRE